MHDKMQTSKRSSSRCEAETTSEMKNETYEREWWNYNLVLGLSERACCDSRREEQTLRLTQISTKISPIVDWYIVME